jgi:hypothetical protein
VSSMRQIARGNTLIQSLLAIDRSRFYRSHLVRINLQARRDLLCAQQPPQESAVARAFIVGCGRSGTTILGSVMSDHVDVTYDYEPQGRWAMVDSRTDIWKKFYPWRSGSLLGVGDVDLRAKKRFARLFRSDTPIILDKSPDHVFRIGFLLGLEPRAKFIHIVRDGMEVAQSVASLAESSYPIFGRHRLNSWWGLDDAKWQFLCRVARSRSYLTKETTEARSDAERGLCEWLLSLNEIRIHRALLGDGLLEMRYEDFVGDTESSLERVASFLQLEPSKDWLASATAAVLPQGNRGSAPVIRSPELLRELARARSEYDLH